MYQPTINKKYFRNKEKRQEEEKARILYQAGKSMYEISEETSLTEYELNRLFNQT